MDRNLLAILAERKGVCLDAGVEEADFKRMVHDRSGIANELIEPLRRHDALPFRINVDAVGRARALRHLS